jgi:hypothetical protein
LAHGGGNQHAVAVFVLTNFTVGAGTGPQLAMKQCKQCKQRKQKTEAGG